jgi:GNAT superfamily N-acetyltransferase
MLQKLTQRARTFWRLLREDRSRLARIVRGNVFIYIVQAAEVTAVPPPPERPGVEFRHISEDALSQLAASYPGLGYPVGVPGGLDGCLVYAVYQGGHFASICSLMTADLDRQVNKRLVRLGPEEMEVVKGFTLPEYRGRGLFTFALQSICRVAQEHGAKCVVAITAWDNVPSRRANEKAGFRRAGWIVVIEPPLIGTAFRPVLQLFRRPLPAGTKAGASGPAARPVR